MRVSCPLLQAIAKEKHSVSIHLQPLVVPLHQSVTLVVQGLEPDTPYTVRSRSRRQHGPGTERTLASNRQGTLAIKGAYLLRGEYLLDILRETHLTRLSFYVAPPELWMRRPLRCDFHIHTHYSDGNSSPARMAVRARELGLDVAVITDHNRYAPSLIAMDEVKRLGLNLITGPGEEVSGPNWHIVAIGASRAIYELGVQGLFFQGDREWQYEALRWAICTTQKYGGRAYLAHPYWSVERGFHLPSSWYDQVLEEGILDGIELLGDVKHENNLRSLARYLDFRATGRDIPILGNSDTHGSEHTFGTYWTLVFAEEPTLEGVLCAIEDRWSVACSTAGRASIAAYGSFELVDYAYWLEEQFFPEHDRLCAREAALAMETLRGSEIPEGTMSGCRAALADLYTNCWG
jgi:hypothetical protein